jgi:hypothetical protein
LCLNFLYKFFGVSSLDVGHRIEIIIVISIIGIRHGYQIEREVDKVVTVRISILNIGDDGLDGGVRSEIDPKDSLRDVVEIKICNTAGKRKRNKRLTLILSIILYYRGILNLC